MFFFSTWPIRASRGPSGTPRPLWPTRSGHPGPTLIGYARIAVSMTEERGSRGRREESLLSFIKSAVGSAAGVAAAEISISESSRANCIHHSPPGRHASTAIHNNTAPHSQIPPSEELRPGPARLRPTPMHASRPKRAYRGQEGPCPLYKKTPTYRDSCSTAARPVLSTLINRTHPTGDRSFQPPGDVIPFLPVLRDTQHRLSLGDVVTWLCVWEVHLEAHACFGVIGERNTKHTPIALPVFLIDPSLPQEMSIWNPVVAGALVE